MIFGMIWMPGMGTFRDFLSDVAMDNFEKIIDDGAMKKPPSRTHVQSCSIAMFDYQRVWDMKWICSG